MHVSQTVTVTYLDSLEIYQSTPHPNCARLHVTNQVIAFTAEADNLLRHSGCFPDSTISVTVLSFKPETMQMGRIRSQTSPVGW